jgi:hypothetical protein
VGGFGLLKLGLAFDVWLPQDKDNGENGRALDFVSSSIDGMEIEIPDFIEVTKDGETEKIKSDKSQIKLGILLEARYRVSFHIVLVLLPQHKKHFLKNYHHLFLKLEILILNHQSLFAPLF